MWLSDLHGIYCIVLQGKFQSSGTSGKFKQMLRCTVFATIICPALLQHIISLHSALCCKKKKNSHRTSDTEKYREIRFCHLKNRQTESLMEHHTPMYTLQQWQMYISIIICRDYSYLCFKGTSSNTFIDSSTPPPSLLLLLLPLSLLFLLFCCLCCCCGC